jgi:membrane protein DedA with SNARE-associated domain
VNIEEIIQWMQALSPMLVYALVFAIAYIENVFPPSPSDTIIVFGGSLAAIGHAGFLETLLAATAGSTLGFVTMYKIGDWFGARILEKGKITFIPVSTVKTVEEWFGKYGYWIVVANRFLSGTRAVVSFFAGMSKLNLLRTTVLSFLSALAWNSLLISAGFYLGKNWERIGFYLSTYSQVVTGILIVGVLIVAAKLISKKSAEGKKG